MATEPKKSTAAVGNISPLTDYADGITTYYTADQYRKSYPVRRDGDVISVSIDSDAYVSEDDDDGNTGEGNNGEGGDGDPKEDPIKLKRAPTLMDIELVSNTVVYDAAKNPSATVVFKIRNSSGETIKGVNYRVNIP